MLIDETFFHGELHIEGLIYCPGVPSETQEATKEELTSLINLYETDYYKKTIGYSNTNLFVEYLGRREDPTESDKKWVDLEKMLVEKIGEKKYSPIAYYIFFYYLRKNQIQVTPLGTTEANTSNKIVSPVGKMIDAWNNMVHRNKYFSEWLYLNQEVYEGYFFDEDLLEDINILGV